MLFGELVSYHLRLFDDLHPDHGIAAMLFVSTVIHRFLDDLVIGITEEFLSAQLEVYDEMWRRRLRKSRDNPLPEE